MKKFLLMVGSLLCMSSFVYSMDVDFSAYKANGFFIESDLTHQRQSIYIEIPTERALSIPLIKQTIQKKIEAGFTSTKGGIIYPNVNQQDLKNFSEYSFMRYVLTQTSGVQDDQIEKNKRDFLMGLEMAPLARLTVMAVDMYDEKVPEGFADVWSKKITDEKWNKLGFLNWFPCKRREVGAEIFDACLKADLLPEKSSKKEELIKNSDSDNDAELGWKKNFNQFMFTCKQALLNHKIAIGSVSLLAMLAAYFYSTKA